MTNTITKPTALNAKCNVPLAEIRCGDIIHDSFKKNARDKRHKHSLADGRIISIANKKLIIKPHYKKENYEIDLRDSTYNIFIARHSISHFPEQYINTDSFMHDAEYEAIIKLSQRLFSEQRDLRKDVDNVIYHPYQHTKIYAMEAMEAFMNNQIAKEQADAKIKQLEKSLNTAFIGRG